MKRYLLMRPLVVACMACDRDAPSADNGVGPANVAAQASTPEAVLPDQPGALPDDRNLVAEGPIDPKSAQGAGQVLQRFAALLERKRFDEASRLGEEHFTGIFPKDAEIHAEIGAPGPIEGAAGSLYVEIPIRFYGKLKDSRSVSQAAIATLRRVNDVPGSTAEQRQWRIYRLDMQPPS